VVYLRLGVVRVGDVGGVGGVGCGLPPSPAQGKSIFMTKCRKDDNHDDDDNRPPEGVILKS